MILSYKVLDAHTQRKLSHPPIHHGVGERAHCPRTNRVNTCRSNKQVDAAPLMAAQNKGGPFRDPSLVNRSMFPVNMVFIGYN